MFKFDNKPKLETTMKYEKSLATNDESKIEKRRTCEKLIFSDREKGRNSCKKK